MFSITPMLLTPNRYSRPQTKLKGVKGVVIHWTANEGNGADADANRNFFENRKYGRTGFGSAHYIIDNHKIVQCIPEAELAYHVGATHYKTTRFGSYPNNCLLGIEMCVNSDGNFSVVYDQTVQLAASLIKKYHLNPDFDLVRHYDITGKNCPAMFTSDHWGKVNNTYAVKYGVGSNADKAWQVFKSKVKAAVEGKPQEPEKYPYDPTKGIGTLEVLVDALNIHKSDSLSSDVIGTVKKFNVYYVYAKSNGMYQVSGNGWVSAGSDYVRYTPHPASLVKNKTKEALAMFKDIINHWAKDDIEALAKMGVIKGSTDGNFHPDDKTTRAETAVMILRAIEYIEKEIK